MLFRLLAVHGSRIAPVVVQRPFRMFRENRLTKQLAGIVYLNAGRAFANTHHLSDFTVAHTCQMAEYDGRLLPVGQTGHHAFDKLREFAAKELRCR